MGRRLEITGLSSAKSVLIVVLLINSRQFKPTNYCLWYQSVSLKKIWWTLDEIFFNKVSRRHCIKVIFVGHGHITFASERALIGTGHRLKT